MKNYKTIFTLILFSLSLVSCEVINEMWLQSGSELKQDDITTIPFSYVKQLIVVDAQINKSEQRSQFIFDTGAFQSKIENGLANQLGLKTVTKRDNGTAQGIKREIEITRVDSIAFANSTFTKIGAGKLTYDEKSYSPCVAEHGIIGANLIQLAHWKIDYQKQEIKIASTPFALEKEGPYHEIDFSTSFLSGVPEIDIQINGKTIENVIFDSGYNGGLILPYRFAKQFPSTHTQTIIDQSTSGIYGTNRDTLLVKQLQVKLDEFSAEMPVEFSSLNKALIGNDFLEHFTIYLDYDQKKIILKPVDSFGIDKPKSFIPGILNDSLWVVNRTSSNLPVNIGDTLKSINGYQPKEVFTSHCDYFLKVSEKLNTDTLEIVKANGEKLLLKRLMY